MSARHIAFAVRTDGDERRRLKPGGDEDEALSEHRTRHVREAIAVADAPDLLAGQRLVGRRPIRADRHELIAIADGDDERRRIRLIGRPAPRGLPSRLAGGRVQGDDVRVAAVAVAIDDQQIAIERRRSAVAMLRLVPQVRRPQNVAGRAQRRRAVGAEVHVDAIAIDDRRRRCAAVLRIDVSGIVETKDLDVDELAAGRDVEGQRAQRCRDAAAPLLGLDDRRQPDAAAGDRGRRPSEAGNGGLPDDVLGFTPLERQTALGGMALTRRAAELRPVLRLCQG